VKISKSRFTTRITLHCLPLLQNPPLHLAIVLARDSEGIFEAPVERPNGLEEAVKKLRVAAYLWQAYTAEQLYRNFPGAPSPGGSARRSFRLEEEWIEDTLSLQETDIWRMSAKIHIVRSELTVEGISPSYVADGRIEIRKDAAVPDGKSLKAIVRDALDAYGSPFNVGESYAGPSPTVLCLLLDSYWFALAIHC
jgi:Putative peptidase family